MKKSILPLLALTLVSVVSATAADKPQTPLTVAVYDFADADLKEGQFAGKITTLVTADLTTETNIVVLERAELKKALSEQAFGASGMVRADAASKIGQLTGAKVIVAGEVIMTDKSHLVIVASIIGTETGRLFAAKADGSIADLLNLSSDLSHKIAQTIASQATNLLVISESRADRLERTINGLQGKNRPSLSVSFLWARGKNMHAQIVEAEFSSVLQKAGFKVVDNKSEFKPDIELTGVADFGAGPRRGDLFSCRTIITAKLRDRRTGAILLVDRQEFTASEPGAKAAERSGQIGVVDEIAERVLPVLAQDR